jgi:hypothetical protein
MECLKDDYFTILEADYEFNIPIRMAKQGPITLEPKLLNKLPLELFLHVIDYLPGSSVLSLSLSCKQVKVLIETYCADRIIGADISTFLTLLERDLPDQVACSACERLHSMENSMRYIPHGLQEEIKRRPNCVSADEEGRPSSFVDGNFSTIVFRMVMKSHAQDSKWTPQLLQTLSRNFAKEEDEYTKVHKTEYRIVEGSLLMRTQITFLTTAWWHFPIPKKKAIEFSICSHLNFQSDAFNTESAKVTSCYPVQDSNIWTTQLAHLMGEARYESSAIQRCRYCRTEFQLYIRHDGPHAKMHHTVWKDLGAGLQDEKWKRHIRQVGDRKVPSRIRFVPGELCSAFQQEEVRGSTSALHAAEGNVCPEHEGENSTLYEFSRISFSN